VFRTFLKLVVYRKDSNKTQVVISIHFTVFKRNVIAMASNLTIFSEYRSVLAKRFRNRLHSVFSKNSSHLQLYGLGFTDGGNGPSEGLYIPMTTQAHEKCALCPWLDRESNP
jgi:hypothetical protein